MAILLHCLLCLTLFNYGSLGQTEEPVPSYSGNYIILVPNTIHPGLPLSISVSILNADSPVTINTAIIKQENDISVTVAQGEAIFMPGETDFTTQVVPDDLISGPEYSLRVSGTGGLVFSQTEDLNFSPNTFSILVQTDKAIYKPGQAINFRAMAIYPDLKTYTGTFNVTLMDPVGNTIKRWIALQNEEHGVVSGETVMSDSSELGDWVFTVQAKNQQQTKTVTIDEYVLPKFEVIVTPPPYFIPGDEQFFVSVEAKYTYGEPVKGSVHMNIQAQYNQQNVISYRAEVDGKTDILVTKEELAGLTSLYSGQLFIFTANVTESLTGITQSGSGQNNYFEKPVKIEELPGNADVYKPGLTYTAYVSVTHVDGSPLTEAERRRKLVVIDSHYADGSRDWIDQINDEVSIPEDGTIRLDFDFPENSNRARFYVSYYYDNNQRNRGEGVDKWLNPAESPSNQYLQIIPQGADFQAGRVSNFEIRTTESPPELTYQVLSRGSIVRSSTLPGPMSLITTFPLDITSSMGPQASLVVSYVRPDNHEVVLDSININVEGVFDNEVTIDFDKEEVLPGEDIQLDITADPSSYVGILAIDTSVMLLKTGNDITQSQVVDALREFDTSSSSSDGPFIDYGFGRPFFRKKRSAICCGWYPYSTPGQNAREVLESSGLLVFTDALIFGEDQSDYMYFQREGIALAGVAVPEIDNDEFEKVAVSTGTPAALPRVRTEFPETWLWNDYIAGDDGRVRVSTVVPDTITSWVASAFGVSTQSGLGVAKLPAKVKVFQPFFISMTLPYSVIRGEKLVLQVTVFNYLTMSVQATVTLTGSAEFLSMTYDENQSEKTSYSDQSQSVEILAGEGVTVYYPILPQKLGLVDLEVTATSPRAGDAVRRQLLVEAEGIPTSYTEPILVDFGDTVDSLTKNFTFDYPKDLLVLGSVRSQITVVGDIMGPTMSGLDKLLRLPSGCGEQTMLSFAPDVFIYKYLSSTNQNNPTVMAKALDFMNRGYQQELTYMHSDNSFSAFGNSDPSGSTWLTAFVIKSFVQATPFIYIESVVIQKSVEWLILQQTRSGNFHEPGRVIHTDMQGGVSSDSTMTAYVLIALKEVQLKSSSLDLAESFWTSVDDSANLATTFLEGKYSEVSEDMYALSLITYALTLANSDQADRFLQAFELFTTMESGVQYWAQPKPPGEENIDVWGCFYYPAPSADIEMTGYGLLTYLARGNVAGGALVARWLTDQRNEFGGYGSTQDTVIGLQALSEYAIVLNSGTRDITIGVTASQNPDYRQVITVNDGNAIVFQKIELPVTSGVVTAVIEGTGSCLVQFSAFYNLMEVVVRPSFILNVTMRDISMNLVIIRACGRYVGGNTVTGMAMLEIGLPSGFYADEDDLNMAVKELDSLQKYDIGKRDVYLYLNGLDRNKEYCYSLKARRDKMVANLKPSNAIIYDYYKPGDQTVASYSSKSLSTASMCDTCPVCCGIDPMPTGGSPTDNGSGKLTHGFVLVATATLVAMAAFFN